MGSGDQLEDFEQLYFKQIQSEGYESGLELGKKDGHNEGYTIGFKEGAKRGAELGYLYGYTMTHKDLVNKQHKKSPHQDQTSMKAIKKYDDILELIDKFPRSNEINCEERLSTIRAKFRKAFAATTKTTETDLENIKMKKP